MYILEPAHRFCSVTQRIKLITQPKGGYLPIRKFQKFKCGNDGIEVLYPENIPPYTVGLAVDYLTRYIEGATVQEAFHIAQLGVKALKSASIDEQPFYDNLLSKIDGLTDQSILAACKLTGYDSAYRAGVAAFKGVNFINPNKNTCENIRIMVERSHEFFQNYGPVVVDGPTFEGGYTDTVATGDGDFITCDTLWDFKVSKNNVNTDQTLQILMYYLMGRRSKYSNIYQDITKLGIFNPRKNMIWATTIKSIEPAVLDIVDCEVIGYRKPFQKMRYNICKSKTRSV